MGIEGLLRPRPGTNRNDDRKLPQRTDLAPHAPLSLHHPRPSPRRLPRRLAGLNEIKLCAGHDFLGRLASTKYSRAGGAAQSNLAVLDAEHRAFSQTYHGSLVLFEK